MNDDEQILLTVEQAAKRLNISRRAIYELISTGAIDSVKIGATRRVPRDATDRYVARLVAEQCGGDGGAL